MKDIIYAFVAHLINMVRFFAPGIVGKTVTALGVGLYFYNVALPIVIGYAQEHAAGLPALALQYFGALGLDVVVTVWLSVNVAKLANKTWLGRLTGG